MPLFIEYTQKTPDDLIEEALVGKRVVKERLSDFCNWLQDVKNKKFNSSVHGSYHIIRGFYSHNDINTQKIRTPKGDPSEVQFSDDNVPLFEIQEIEQEGQKIKKKIIRREFLKNFFDCLIQRDKIIAMCIKDSGLDSGDVLGLTLDTIRNQNPNQERIFIRMTRNKTREIFATFLTKETSKFVKNYEKMYRKDTEDSEPLFAQSAKEFKIKFHQKHGRPFDRSIDEMKLSGVDPHSFSRNFRNATQKLEKLLSDKKETFRILQYGKQSPLRPKRFRKVFNDACDIAGIPTDIKRVFMGKSDPSNKTYEGKSRMDLEIFYEKLEPILTIYSEPSNAESQVKKLQEELNTEKNKKSEINELEKRLSDTEIILRKIQDRLDNPEN